MYVVLSKIKSSEWVKFGPGKGYGICGSVCSVQKSDNATDGCLELHYQNPQEDDTQFSVARLEGSKTPERVLKSNNYNDRQNGQYRPTTGFTKNVPQATLSDTGHRILRHETSDNQRRDNRPAPYHRNPSNGNS
ncbi:5'-3' exoribonuclease 2 [Aphelenchoides bicaudatus]|nr:5'-3' exoribonuclease 2 [Aphelenchoides bicaudatus]